MLVNENLIRYIKYFVKLHRIWGTCPLKFDPSSETLSLTSKSRQIWELFKTITYSVCGVILWYQLLYVSREEDLAIRLISWLIAVGTMVCALSKWELIKKKEEFMELFNLFVKFEHRHAEELKDLPVPKWESRFMKGVSLYAIVRAPGIVTLFSFQRWYGPCNSIQLGYFAIPECQSGDPNVEWSTISSIIVFLLIFLMNWLHDDGMGCFAFWLLDLSFIQGYCFMRYLQQFERQLSSSTKNDRFELYRELQVLNRYYNLTQQKQLIPATIIYMQLLFITGVYEIVALGYSRIGTVGILWCAEIAGESFVIDLVYSSMQSKVHVMSKDGIRAITERIVPGLSDRRKRRWLQRYTRSLQPLKTFIGTVNYMDEETPLNLLNFCVNQIVSLLMAR
ncbi:unnamed protein product [Orchesella dallaii]|uniref:Odorant receptor n=1 Tax=Orchesella dallaii TaxID=48710 RepID=A0ABP1PIV6_9HEXA